MSIQASAGVEGPCTGQTEELRRPAMVEELWRPAMVEERRRLAKAQRTYCRPFWWRGGHGGWLAGVVEQPRGHDTRARVAC
jgi:hypothetical protein